MSRRSSVKAEFRDEILLSHIVNLTDQLGRFAAALRKFGMAVPEDVGTLGVAEEDVFLRLWAEADERRAAKERGEPK